MTSPAKSVLTLEGLPVRTGTIYPAEYAGEVAGRSAVAMGNPFDLTQFGVNLVTLDPGAWSSHRHWHAEEDEWVYALEGEMVLIDNAGRHSFTPGMFAGFKANNGNGHHIINESAMPAKFIVVGTRAKTETANYPDINMHGTKGADGKFVMTRKDGSPFKP